MRMLAFLAVVALLAVPDAARGQRNAHATGTFVLDDPGDAGCTLRAQRQGASAVRFHVECNRGAPSYNMGTAEGVVPLARGVAVWRTDEYGGRCTLQFRFRSGEAVVTQDGDSSACGFGFDVYAGGRYRRTSRRPPSFD